MESLAISVVFSTHNGAARLPRMLESLCRQDLPVADWELIAIDNASTDGTAGLLAGYAELLPITIMSHPVPGKSGALNQGIARARGELIVFTDDDIRAEPGWLAALRKAAEAQPDYGVFGGRIVPEFEAPPEPSLMERIPLGSTFAVIEDTESGPCPPERIWGPNMAIRRSLLDPETRYREDLGPLPGGRFAMGEDLEIVVRLARRGVATWRAAEAVVWHHVPSAALSEQWVQARAERLGYGMPAVFPERVPRGPRLKGVPLAVWAQSGGWLARAALLSALPGSRLRFWAIWQTRYLRGYRAGIRRFLRRQGEKSA